MSAGERAADAERPILAILMFEDCTHSMGNQPKKSKQPLVVLPRLLIAEEVANAIRKSPKTIYKWAKQGRIPSVINIGGSILFDPEGTKKWIDQHRLAA